MKIINEDNKQVRCDECNTLLEYDSLDINKGYITCPCCENKIKVEDNNIYFPINYYHFEHGEPLSNGEIDNYVKLGIDYLKHHEKDDYYSVALGTTIIFIVRDEDEGFEVNVCHNYYSGYIDKSNIL